MIDNRSIIQNDEGENGVITVNSQDTIRRAKELRLLAEIYRNNKNDDFIDTAIAGFRELERTSMLLEEVVRQFSELKKNLAREE